MAHADTAVRKQEIASLKTAADFNREEEEKRAAAAQAAEENKVP